MLNSKQLNTLFVSLTILLLAYSSASAVTDWGIKGVSDTSKVTNVVQLTSTNEAVGQNALMGGSYVGSNTGNVQPWSKDGKWIVFSSRVDGESDSDEEVCKIEPDGSSFTRLTNNTIQDSNASFSTNSMVYYNINNLGNVLPNWKDRIWRMNQFGSGKTDLSAAHSAPDADDERSVIVSPNGSKIAYYLSGALMVANSDGTSPLPVSGTYNAGANNIDVYEGQYSWSPDSQWLVYSGWDGTGYYLFKVKANGTSHTQLTSAVDVSHYWPSWSPDSSKIAYRWYQYSGGANHEVRIIDSSNGAALKTLDTTFSNVTSDWSQIIAPFSWSPDSTWLAYGKYYQGDGTPADPTYKAIFIINTEESGPAPSQLTTGYNDYFPIWAPHGSQIVFQSEYNYLSREDDCDPSCTDRGDILILNLIGDYGDNSVSLFPWTMFMPAIQSSAKQ